MKKKLVTLLVLMAMAMTLAACSGNQASEDQSDGRIIITSLYHEDLTSFEELVESTYPDIDLQIERSEGSTYNDDTLRRLRNGYGKDIVFTSMPNSEVAGYLLDLSANSFATRYSASAMSVISQDGKTIYLPMPSVYRGCIVNKTLVNQLGLSLPATQQEFFDLCAAAKAQGVGVSADGFCFAMHDIDGIPLGEMILGSAVPDFLGTMEGERWTSAFLAQQASAQGALGDHLQFFVSLTESGYMDPSRMNLDTITKDAVPTNLHMADRTMLACYGSSGLLAEIRERNTQDEFVMLPYLSAEGNESWVTLMPASYVGVNAAIASDEHKLNAALRVLDLLSTPEGQAAVLKNTSSDSSYLAQAVEGSGLSHTGLEEYVERGYVYNMNRFHSDVLWIIGKAVTSVCEGTATMDEAMASVDAVNRGEPASLADDYTLVGSLAESLPYEDYNVRTGETALGNLIADAVREYAGADMAFVNGGGIRASLYVGDVFASDIAVTMPYDNKIVVLDVKGDVIWQMLENSISELKYQATPGGRFLQVSGVTYTFSVDPSTEVTIVGQEKPAESKLASVTLPNGTPLDREATYRIAVNDYMCGKSGYVASGDNFTMLNVFDESVPKAEGVTFVEAKEGAAAQALLEYFRSNSSEAVSSSLEGRIVVVEAR